MKTFLYSVFDTKSGVYDRPFVFRTDEEAKRGFGDICNDENHPIGKHPEDFYICRVGTWDDNKGLLIPEEAPETIMTGLDALSMNNVTPISEVN